MKISIFLSLFFTGGLLYGQNASPVSFDTVLLLQNLEAFSADSMAGRGTGEPGGMKAQSFIANRFESLGLLQFDSSYKHTFSFANPFKKSKITGTNMLAWVKGSKYPDKYIVISSHHDHLGNRNGNIYNGADDNGSGTCALFAIAEYLTQNPPLHSVILAAFDAEENGLIGSKHFVNKPPVPLKHIVFNLNMDMISRDEEQEIFICGTHHYEKLKPLLADIDSASKIKVTYGHDHGSMRTEDWTYASDHGSFYKKKIPFVYLGVEDHEDYHQPTDDFERIDQVFYVEAVRVAISIVSRVDNEKGNLK